MGWGLRVNVYDKAPCDIVNHTLSSGVWTTVPWAAQASEERLLRVDRVSPWLGLDRYLWNKQTNVLRHIRTHVCSTTNEC